MLMINRPVEVVGLLNMVVEVEEVKSSLLRYHAQWLVEGATRKTSSTSRDRGTSISDHQMRQMMSRSETGCCTALTRPSKSPWAEPWGTELTPSL